MIISGFDNEKNIVKSIDGLQFRQLNDNLKKFIKELFPEITDNDILKANALGGIYKRDLEKLKTDFNKIYETKYPNGAHTYIYQDFKAVLNKENKGLVGYAVYVKLYASEANLSIDKSTAENLIAEYYLKSDGSREYIQNPYNIN